MKQIIIKTLIGIMVATCSLNANAQVKAFEKYADMKNVTYVYISKYMLAMAGKNATPSVPGVDIKTLAGKLTGIQIINTENNQDPGRQTDGYSDYQYREQRRQGETEERRQDHFSKGQVRVADADERGRQQGEHLPLYRQTAVGRGHADRRQR